MAWLQAWRLERRKAWIQRHLGAELDALNRMAASLGVKSVQPQDLVSYWQVGKATWTSDWTLANAVESGLKACSALFACIRRRSEAVSSVRFIGVRRKGTESTPVDVTHPLQVLLDHPNTYWSRQALIGRLVAHLDLKGDAYLSKVRLSERKPPSQLWPLCPDLVTPIPGGKGEPFVKGYGVKTADGRELPSEPAADIIHLWYDNPADDYRGLAPLQACGRSVDADVAAADWNKAALDNRAVPDFVVSHAYPLTEEQWTEARARVREQHQGSANARTPWVLGNDAKITQLSLTPVEMDFLSGRRFNREEIASVYGVPLPLIGDYEKATLNNLEVSRAIFWLDTIIPLLIGIASTLELGLAREFGDEYGIGFDLSKVSALYQVLQGRMETAKGLFSMGVPVSQINDRLDLGLMPFPGWESGWLPANLVPVGAVTESAGGGLEEEE